MDFAFTDEQEALRDMARQRLAGPPPSWAELGALGWLDKDLGAVEVAVLAEEAGRARAADAWLLTQALAWPTCHAASLPLDQPATLAWSEPPPGPAGMPGPLDSLRCRAEADGGAVRLRGAKARVPYTAGVEAVLVLACGPDGPGLYRLDLADAEADATTVSTVDGDRPWLALDLRGAPAEPLLTGAAAADAVRRTWARALTLLACEAVGLARAALDGATAHARSRVQFGRAIGTYQAVSHRLADVYAATELATSLAYRAAWCLDAEPAAAEEAAAAAAVSAREAVLSACEAEIQTLGATGFTWAHPVNGRYRRARWIACFDTATSDLRAGLAARLLDGEL